jgi:hypothetical protein
MVAVRNKVAQVGVYGFARNQEAPWENSEEKYPLFIFNNRRREM